MERQRRQVGAVGLEALRVARLGVEVSDVALDIGLQQAHTVARERVAKGQRGYTAFDGDEHGLVVLVAVVVDHDHDLAQPWEDAERAPVDEFGVL